ncbi:MAG TPA: DNA polymerase III subunit beta [Anaerohalosphaeraceae bacterium]|nr:DNA polymerase III subunit beta [Phycisphaerae bacterium]HOK96197.1 DNA polymerase III subunit beta [Anaerohalosphaeraceae bacterium]HOL30454.1 DNA polymerase III subunit beta [Anaerohalosphaeraceae bacterium]HOM76767.1 DNA polymerase III subunit beta [Anaerohalosphaeraceae bacterium]HPC64077.1 DNA polymerase III subunit beta [Anaerohalosphaeraceae bacterium]
MKVKFNRAALQEALGLVTTVIPSRTPKPILQCLKITTEKESIRIGATDLEAGITYLVNQVEIDKPGEVIVPAEKLSSIVRESQDDVLLMEATESAVNLVGSDSRFTIYGHDPQQYPTIPVFDGTAELEVKLLGLQEGIEQTVFAAARESTRYALNGVLWEVAGKKLSLVATDGRRLAKATVALEKSGKIPDGRIIVPARTMSLLLKITQHNGDETAQICFVNNQIVLASGSVVVSSNLVEGNFPKYEDIIPKDYEKKLTLNTAQMLSAVRRAALLANEDSKGIRLALDKGSLVLTSRAPETGDAQIDMAVDYSGEPIEIGFNPQFLIDVLRVIGADTFELHLGQPDRPGLIKSGSNFLYIVMPVNL